MSRRLPLCSSPASPHDPRFRQAVRACGRGPLVRRGVATLQVNVGKLCNMACQHCHVDAGPKRTEIMARAVAERLVELLAEAPEVAVVDLTGGAPELNPSFRWLVTRARALGKHVLDRCNLSVLFEPGQEDLPEFLARHGVEIVASLPCYSSDNVDAQRGRGAFETSIRALVRLNRLGYGLPGSPLVLRLVYNPVGPSLPPDQAGLEAAYRARLRAEHGIEFHSLLTITNMPIRRFAHQLERDGQLDAYMELLAQAFNPETIDGLMCQHQISVGYDGALYDCDFNQMLEIPAAGWRRTVWEISSLSELLGQACATGAHCFGCTAGAGSSCSGALQ